VPSGIELESSLRGSMVSETRKAQKRADYHKHKVSRLAQIKVYEEANPEKIAYRNQAQQARKRGIPFLFTLDEWIAWWGADFSKRGNKQHDLQMCRKGDSGAYELDNVYKDTAMNNGILAGSQCRTSFS